MTAEIATVDEPATPALVVRRAVRMDQIGEQLTELLPRVHAHCERTGAPIAGPPIVRYLAMDAGVATIEAGVPLAAPQDGEGDVEPVTLGGQTVAVTMHAGSYDNLGETYRHLEQWMTEQGLVPDGAPWEQYIVDPGETPDQSQWRTAVRWPVRAAG